MAAEAKYGQVLTEKKLMPADEPVFLLRAQDSLAPEALIAYAEARSRAGDKAGADAVRRVVESFRAWPVQKLPD